MFFIGLLIRVETHQTTYRVSTCHLFSCLLHFTIPAYGTDLSLNTRLNLCATRTASIGKYEAKYWWAIYIYIRREQIHFFGLKVFKNPLVIAKGLSLSNKIASSTSAIFSASKMRFIFLSIVLAPIVSAAVLKLENDDNRTLSKVVLESDTNLEVPSLSSRFTSQHRY